MYPRKVTRDADAAAGGAVIGRKVPHSGGTSETPSKDALGGAQSSVASGICKGKVPRGFTPITDHGRVA